MVPDYQISQDPDVQQFFENVLNSSLQYFSELIDINHINYVTESQFYCSDYYSENSIDMGDADVLLIISNSSQGNYLVLGGTCYLDTQNNKAPNIMYLKVQKYIIEQVYDIYQENGVNGGLYYQYLRSINHEIFHNLAFRIDYFSNYPIYDYSSQVYDFLDTKPRGYPTLAMITENVKKEVQDFFGCPNYEGMQLENANNNQQNAYIEHLESTIFGNNLMSYLYILEPRGFSRVELAILDDSNWYNSINYDLADVYFWGKDKGCDFLENSCIDLQNKFEEFKTKQFGCSFDYKSKAIQASQYKNGQYTFYTDKCDFMYSYLPCNTGIYNQDSKAEIYESFQSNSRCFESTLRNKGEQIQTISQML
ncbi:hypothetical protein PPERSA_08357 [Pseudocohnilembus persalinus]|uniref:Leishmanolysin family protein n=1 Tax=Pseudocohnilembus persalinus TaxID=266149 RepID=A0A0V0QMC4_PSEPJ|nr:hypothetical protein PPERSA_08357 [Pseudocohnilembus persalinus]|eukprot:KRX03303.1 hypothetical protein PPERSA_08357 [Pseudocohnilembus persalinus]